MKRKNGLDKKSKFNKTLDKAESGSCIMGIEPLKDLPGSYLLTLEDGVQVEKSMSEEAANGIMASLDSINIDDTRIDEENNREKPTTKRTASRIDGGFKDPSNNGKINSADTSHLNRRKGTVSWTPGALIQVDHKDPHFVYRWGNMSINGRREKLLNEQWEEVTSTTSGSVKIQTGSISDSSLSSTNFRRRELQLFRMPREVAEARDRYHKQRQALPDQIMDEHDSKMGVYNGQRIGYGRVED
ncbi:MAG: hypothetical protein O2963_00175 [Proteobacteria bacterium]|nr:hypothetical protein [Pseudomonadota bacterium]